VTGRGRLTGGQVTGGHLTGGGVAIRSVAFSLSVEQTSQTYTQIATSLQSMFVDFVNV